MGIGEKILAPPMQATDGWAVSMASRRQMETIFIASGKKITRKGSILLLRLLVFLAIA